MTRFRFFEDTEEALGRNDFPNDPRSTWRTPLALTAWMATPKPFASVVGAVAVFAPIGRSTSAKAKEGARFRERERNHINRFFWRWGVAPETRAAAPTAPTERGSSTGQDIASADASEVAWEKRVTERREKRGGAGRGERAWRYNESVFARATSREKNRARKFRAFFPITSTRRGSKKMAKSRKHIVYCTSTSTVLMYSYSKTKF